MSFLEEYFSQFRRGIVGVDTTYESPYGEQRITYADWIASGRLYAPIEGKMLTLFGPMVANTHTESNETGRFMTEAYHCALGEIKRHVNAGRDDVIVTAGFGMTSAINKFQRMLGLKDRGVTFQGTEDRPVVFVTHMEHHSNQTSWYETEADVVVVAPDERMLVSPQNLRETLEQYRDRRVKVGSFTACSNVTGIKTPYHELARIMHEHGGVCFVDFAASAPYVDIDMHPENPLEKLDAVLFSPHKFLGGPGSSGVLIFDSKLYRFGVPDQPGGGTVDWTNPWGEYKYIDDIERREDGGTPGFLQAIRTALAIRLKDQMGVDSMQRRERELVDLAFDRLSPVPGLHILADSCRDRIGAISFYIDGIHYNLIVSLLSDRFGVQMRGGCACAGTYGHFLLQVTPEKSHAITALINHGDLSLKPGWVRWSIHPTTTNAEVELIASAVGQIAQNAVQWGEDYQYDKRTNEFVHRRRSSYRLFDAEQMLSL
ncbi:MAG: aminotransferase class V-fold PLP-dependent enzyme [Bacteroidales bacterium]